MIAYIRIDPKFNRLYHICQRRSGSSEPFAGRVFCRKNFDKLFPHLKPTRKFKKIKITIKEI